MKLDVIVRLYECVGLLHAACTPFSNQVNEKMKWVGLLLVTDAVHLSAGVWWVHVTESRVWCRRHVSRWGCLAWKERFDHLLLPTTSLSTLTSLFGCMCVCLCIWAVSY